MNRILLILLAVSCLALASPPAVPKRVKRAQGGPSQGDAAAALIKPRAPPVPQFVWLRLDWDYPAPMDGIAFNVYQRQSSTPSWAILARVQGSTSYQFPVSSGPNVVYFAITSSNTVTGLESDLAHP